MQTERQATGFAAKSTVAEESEIPCEPGMYGKGGIVLIPKPSNDPQDPLVCCRSLHEFADSRSQCSRNE